MVDLSNNIAIIIASEEQNKNKFTFFPSDAIIWIYNPYILTEISF